MTYFSILGLPNISGTAEDTNLKFCMRLERNRSLIKKLKNWPKQCMAVVM